MSIDAERHVLGAVLANPAVLDDLTTIITGRDLYDPRHAAIWDVMVELSGEGIKAEPTAVAQRLIKTGSNVDPGYVAELYSALPVAAQATYHARQITEAALLRRLAGYGTRITQMTESGRDASAVVAAARSWLDDVETTTTATGPLSWANVITRGMDAIEAAGDSEVVRGLPTSLPDLDRVIGGLKPGTVTVVAGRPGSGKSLLAAQFATHAALDLGEPVLFVSLEMSAEEIYNRVAASTCTVPLHLLNAGGLDDRHWSKLSMHAGRTAEAPLYIEDSPNLTMADIRALARRHQTRHGLKLLIIDYLQLVSVPSNDNRQVAVAELSRAVKLLAKELDIAIVLVAQVNRGPEQRIDQRPKASDLRESGAIEADADTVILVHTFDDKSPRTGECDLIVDKNRHGPKRDITVIAQFGFARFASYAKD